MPSRFESMAKIKPAVFTQTNTGDKTVIAAVTGKQLKIVAAVVTASAAAQAQFEDGTGGTNLSGNLYLAAGGNITLPYNPAGWFVTTAATLLNVQVTGTAVVEGFVLYQEL